MSRDEVADGVEGNDELRGTYLTVRGFGVDAAFQLLSNSLSF